LLEQRADKNGKPYFVCEPCGTQFFIRGTAGRERLAEVLRSTKAFEAKDHERGAAEVSSQAALQADLMLMQSLIETFCVDETVIPLAPFALEIAVSFSKWSGDVCDRISSALDWAGTLGKSER